LATFDAEKFVKAEIEEIRSSIGDEKALVAVSGGVDSTTSAVLTHKAIGENLVCVMLDDAFMREGESKRVAEILLKPPLNVPITIVDVRERFLQAMKGLRDAEEKRKMFRETFYQVLGETVRKERCSILVQGTIRADVIETAGGVKTQHNILEQIGINPMERYGFRVVEPLVSLYKSQVRMVARSLGLPAEISERQPFPGPGLSVRVVGEIRADKLEALKKATAVAEKELSLHKPSQYLAAILNNEQIPQPHTTARVKETVARFLNVPSRHVHVKIFMDKVTGVKGGKRHYGEIVGIKAQTMNGKVHQTPIRNLVSLQAKITTENPTITRVVYTVKDLAEEKLYVTAVRAVQTKDFLTAKVSEIPWTTLNKVAEAILEKCRDVSSVYYDVTPKPPATIEME
jgi:GMP synthase (glutamine-hydrolysing)